MEFIELRVHTIEEVMNDRRLLREEENEILRYIEERKKEFDTMRIDEDMILSNIEKKREEFKIQIEQQEKENKVAFIMLNKDVYCSMCNIRIEEKDYNRLSYIYGKDINNVPDNDMFCIDCISSPFWRTGTLNKDCSTGIGYITEVLVAKFLGIKTCFDIEGKFNHLAFDMYEHDDWLKINVKGATRRGNGWSWSIRKNKIANFFFCIGYDKYRKHIEVVYIIPNDENICNMSSLYISVDDYNYEWFKEDETLWDKLFHTLRLENCPVIFG